MNDEWEPAETVAKNQAGEYQALIGGQWVPATAAAKNEAGEYRVVRQQPAPQEQKPFSFMETIKPFLHLAIPGGGGLKLMDALNKGAYDVGGKVTDIASNLGASPEIAAGAGVAAKTGIEALPVAAGGFVGSKLAPAMRSGAERMMGWAINPTAADAVSGKAARAAKTFLDEGLSPTVEGTQELRRMGTNLNDEVFNLLEQSGKTINRPVVGSYIQDVIKRVEGKEFSQDPMRAVERVYDQFLSNPLLGKNIPATQAQELKQGIYSELKKKYGVLGTDTEEAMKAVARGYKTELEKAVPEVIAKNARASELWNALNVSERKAYMELNKTPGGGFAIYLMHNPAVAAAYMGSKSAAFKALVAHTMNIGKSGIPVTAGATAGAAADIANQQR